MNTIKINDDGTVYSDLDLYIIVPGSEWQKGRLEEVRGLLCSTRVRVGDKILAMPRITIRGNKYRAALSHDNAKDTVVKITGALGRAASLGEDGCEEAFTQEKVFWENFAAYLRGRILDQEGFEDFAIPCQLEIAPYQNENDEITGRLVG